LHKYLHVMKLPAVNGQGICVCRFGFSRTGTTEVEQ